MSYNSGTYLESLIRDNVFTTGIYHISAPIEGDVLRIKRDVGRFDYMN